jgi:zinc protease
MSLRNFVLVFVLQRASRPYRSRPSSVPKPITVPYQMFTLPNGLTVILHEDHSVPLVSVNVWYHVGSANEKPGRTGFAHLFEHLMFEGSKNVKEGMFDTLLETAGGGNNASTYEDKTNYYIDVPSNSLDLALYLESDRMGYLLDIVTEATVNGQRDVVKNERRQSYENAPYGMAEVRIPELMYPKNHPYRWPVIGYMEDLTAASAEDVREFFRKYYAPQNASIVIAGDINPAEARKKVEYWFADVKPGKSADPIEVPPVVLPGIVKDTLTDQVQLPRLSLVWLSPALYAPGDAELDVVASILTGGKNSRLYKRLVYELQVAQSVVAFQASANPRLAVPHRHHRAAVEGAAGAGARETEGSGGRGNREAAIDRADGPRSAAGTEPDRVVVLQPDGARRQLRGQGGSVERLLRAGR